MNLVKVGAAVVNQTPFDWDNNEANILAAIAAAKAAGVSVLCLPELCICGYGCEDAFHSAGLRRMARQVLARVLPATRGLAVALGLPVLYRNGLYNTACLAVDGRIVGFAAKRHLAGAGLHYEPRWFKAWPQNVVAEVALDGQRYPIGDLHFELGPIKIGFEICEDAWVAQRPGAGLAQHGVDIILNPSASHFAFGKFETRKRFVLEGSRAFGVTYVYSNLVGNEAGRAIYDGGALIASAGKLVAAGRRFTFKPFELTSAVVDIDATRTAQASTGSGAPTGARDEGCIAVDFQFPDVAPAPAQVEAARWEQSDTLQEEEFTRALALALFDYMRKSRSHGFVVSLSGGADSASVACLVALMVALACDELGIEAFQERLSYMSIDRRRRLDIPGLVSRLLTCVYQSTRHSSATTRAAARQVAEAIGAEFLQFDVQPLVDQYVALVSKAVGRTLTWAEDDTALQNIQARARGPSVWMLANLKQALLTATSNRSEAAVGYATMDGDTCGGLSPIAGIDKAFIRRWLRWLESRGPDGLAPIPALQAVNAQQPTAELRPLDAGQTDEQDLMPYDLLDAIENAAIGGKHTPVEVLQLMRTAFPHYDDRQLVQWIERFFGLWCRNQWKRERYAPCFHVDDKNLDPKTWCRFPILSGGFERELAELRAAVIDPT